MDVLEAALMETLNTPTLSLKLENPYRTFRTAREIEKDGHGNYISGVIEFNPAPKSDEVIVNYRLVHVLWYDILGSYFRIILQYFGMKIK